MKTQCFRGNDHEPSALFVKDFKRLTGVCKTNGNSNLVCYVSDLVASLSEMLPVSLPDFLCPCQNFLPWKKTCIVDDG